MKNAISKNFQVPLDSLYNVKTAKSSLARGHMGGGDWGYLELGPETPPWVRGSIYKKKGLQDQGPITHTSAAIRKEVLTPPPNPPSQKGVPKCRGGGYGGPNQKKSSGHHFWS